MNSPLLQRVLAYQKQLVIGLFVAGAFILAASAWFWCHKVATQPERVFWNTVEQSLATRGVTIETSQENNGTKVRQYIQYELGATNKAHAFTTVVQGDNEVKTEVIGTPEADYTRYVAIKTTHKAPDGKQLDLSKVLGVWAKSTDIARTTPQSGGQQLLSQAVLGIGLPGGSIPIPTANLEPAQRAQLLDLMQGQNLYTVNFADVEKRSDHGRLQYIYDVRIHPLAYVNLMKTFGRYVGLHDLDNVDPNEYRTAVPLEVRVAVDVRAQQVVAIEWPGVAYTQRYSGHGLSVAVQPPTNAIKAEELQQRLNSLR